MALTANNVAHVSPRAIFIFCLVSGGTGQLIKELICWCSFINLDVSWLWKSPLINWKYLCIQKWFFISNQSRVQYTTVYKRDRGELLWLLCHRFRTWRLNRKKNKQLNKTKQKSIMAATESQSVFNDALVAMAWCEEFEKKPERKEKKKRRKISTYRDVYIRREEVRVRAGVCDPIW
jgi:hypothetical protein